MLCARLRIDERPATNDKHAGTVDRDRSCRDAGAAAPRHYRRIDWRKTFSALRHRNFRLFFWGQLVSLIGTWMQTVALNWLVYTTTNSALALGFINFLQAIPITLLTLPAGVLADRHNKRNILIATQTASMLLPSCWRHGPFPYRPVLADRLMSLLFGVVNAFDIPTRQSFVVDMTSRDDLMNAIALNSSMFNGARVFGPALAGVLIAYIGTAAVSSSTVFRFWR